jgi:hypothetical protein
VAELEKIIADMEDASKRARREALLAIAKSGRPRTMRFPIRAFAVDENHRHPRNTQLLQLCL